MGLYERDYIKDSQLPGTFTSRVYGWMTAGLSVTALVSIYLYYSGLYKFLGAFWMLYLLGNMGISLFIRTKFHTLSTHTTMGLFIAYSVLEGLFFGTLIPSYIQFAGGGVVWAAFIGAAVTFGIASLYGAFTKHDLTAVRNILWAGLSGFLVLSLVFVVLSLFMQLPFVYLGISYIGLALFLGLSVVDAQEIRKMARSVGNDSVISYKLSLIMALRMYCNVTAIFIYLLSIFSSSARRD
ncbi:inhibitor of apoptosis-promoting Bax1 family protein [Chlamydia ibidis]|uniref:Inhibitor of apoptosis-promoting Bax1 family protein n=2 Tax=Chlamydia ibidis TaxID=1405396 RepID=S7J3N0_9CHLA|nr:Bax inhibitor-1/YccA family protein [Chlamydia ibidis]EPP34813.1 inhibitor of apoptosis-promoting Bax1 family protein [Chlamydia ibidis]EQM62322.1 inhibitor of apoptosis-promoting Bax1 family protein [Chlamydia ibidis 10-1398/6]